jgi:hypothetical protein
MTLRESVRANALRRLLFSIMKKGNIKISAAQISKITVHLHVGGDSGTAHLRIIWMMGVINLKENVEMIVHHQFFHIKAVEIYSQQTRIQFVRMLVGQDIEDATKNNKLVVER